LKKKISPSIAAGWEIPRLLPRSTARQSFIMRGRSRPLFGLCGQAGPAAAAHDRNERGQAAGGLLLYKEIHPVHRHAELEQMHIISECQNRGLGKDALGTVLHYLFRK